MLALVLLYVSTELRAIPAILDTKYKTKANAKKKKSQTHQTIQICFQVAIPNTIC